MGNIFSGGLIDLSGWGYVLVALGLTHISIASVTIYLHRCQAHRALDLHPSVSHFFRFWLWLTTGMVTRQWVAIHRKHHAHVESEQDPHSPQVQGINKILWLGAWVYHQESRNRTTIKKYGRGAPADWIEHRLYTPYSALGISLLLVIELILFGLPGATIWLIQMAWIPFWAAGVINGIGHYAGYRNYEVPDASKNIVPWGLIIGGEELHNNHHAYASSAKFSIKPWEFDLGWCYIRILSVLGLARVKKLPPALVIKDDKHVFDLETVRAVVNNRVQIMANFIKEVMQHVWAEEMQKVRSGSREHLPLLKRARRLMYRESTLLTETARGQLYRALDLNPTLQKVYAMKQRLQEIWSKSAPTQEHMLKALEDWCKAAENSGIDALREFSMKLKRYELSPSAV
ncbi:MAG: transposase [Gammaproteobacteria bacterium]|nr:transposase [Gammaproteobacteria bacterium]